MKLAFLGLLATALASLGDDLPEFGTCLTYCDVIRCEGLEKYPEITKHKYQELIHDTELQSYFSPAVTVWDKLLGWDCFSNCDYECQRLITTERAENDLEIYQFHGKWPFIRVLGVQELFSTLFSIGNFLPNYWGFKLIYKNWKIERDSDFKYLYFCYLIVASVSMGAWTFSTIFHLKDTWNRERLDYFFAGMTVLSGFHGIIVRFFHLYKAPKKAKLFSIFCVLLYFLHVTKLLNDWSYTYNMQANIIIGVVQYVLWITLSIKQFKALSNSRESFIHNFKNKDINWTLIPIALVVSVMCGMSFEVFDFAPIGDLLDAHALWHFATIWPAIWWYPYMIRDTLHLKSSKHE